MAIGAIEGSMAPIGSHMRDRRMGMLFGPTLAPYSQKCSMTIMQVAYAQLFIARLILCSGLGCVGSQD